MEPARRPSCSEAAEAAAGILDFAFLAKALNPQNRRDFLVIQRRVAQALRSATADEQSAALRSALRGLDLDWPGMTASGREAALRAVRASLRGSARRVAPKVEETLILRSTDVARSSRAGIVARFNLSIPSSLSLRDERLAEWCASSQSLFVRDRLGRRADALSRRAREIVSQGLDSGLGRDDIAERLAGLAQQGLGGAMPYWQVVAGAFVGRTRTAINVSSFAEAGVEKYRWEAVLDEATCDSCRFLHGREFSVRKASERIDAASKLSDPEGIRTTLPWINRGTDDEGRPVLYYGSGDDRSLVARVEQTGEGERDRIGRYGGAMSSSALEAAGASTPPAHGGCRCTTLAVV